MKKTLYWEVGDPWNFDGMERSRDNISSQWTNSKDADTVNNLLNESGGFGRNYAIELMEKIGELMLETLKSTEPSKRFEVAAKGRKIAEISSYLLSDKPASVSADEVIEILNSMRININHALVFLKDKGINPYSTPEIIEFFCNNPYFEEVPQDWMDLFDRRQVFEDIVNSLIPILQQVSNNALSPQTAIDLIRSNFGEEAYEYGTKLNEIGEYLTEQFSTAIIFLGGDNSMFSDCHVVPFASMDIFQTYHDYEYDTSMSEIISIKKSILFNNVYEWLDKRASLGIPDYNGISGMYRIFCDLIYRFSIIDSYKTIAGYCGDVYVQHDHDGFVQKTDGSLSGGSLLQHILRHIRERSNNGQISLEELDKSKFYVLSIANLIRHEILSDFEQIHNCKNTKLLEQL